MRQRPRQGRETRERRRERVYETPLSSKHFARGGEGCLPSPRLKGGLEGRGRNQQPVVPWPRAERWCVCRPHPSHLSATLKPDYSRLMSARQGPATRCSWIPSPRGQITPACSGPFGVGFMGRPSSTCFVCPTSPGDITPSASEGQRWLPRGGCPWPSAGWELWVPQQHTGQQVRG